MQENQLYITHIFTKRTHVCIFLSSDIFMEHKLLPDKQLRKIEERTSDNLEKMSIRKTKDKTCYIQ